MKIVRYKPVELKYIFAPIREEFEYLFAQTFDQGSNSKFLNHVMTCFGNRRWADLLKLMSHVQKQAIEKKTIGLELKLRYAFVHA